MKLVVLGIAGALGTLSRYALGGFIAARTSSAFPYETLLINFLGCLAIGFLGTIAEERSFLSPAIRSALLIGFLGAFTTYSSYAYETWNLLKAGEMLSAAINVGGTTLLCLVGVVLGAICGRII